AAWHVIAEEGFARSDLVDLVQPLDGVVGHRGGEIPGSRCFADVGIDLGRVAKQVRFPLTGVAPNEAVEILEAHADGPLIERPGLARREGRSVVVLAEPGGGEAVVQQNAADSRLIFGDDAIVARETGGLLGDDAEADRVMVAARNERSPRRRAE